MFIYNININKNKISKICLCFFVAILIIASMVFIHSRISNSNKVYVTDSTHFEEVMEIPASNYTNVLKDCNENLDKYVGIKIKFSGFVHRLYDFTDNQFVLGREMIMSNLSDNQSEVVIVGFLCDYEKALSFNDNTWVEIEGTITKGFYHSEIPIVKINAMKSVNCPEDQYVYPPDNGYISL